VPPEYKNAHILNDGLDRDDLEYHTGFWLKGIVPQTFQKQINLSAAFDDDPTLYEIEALLSANPEDTASNDFHDFMYYMGETALNTYIDTDSLKGITSRDTREAIINSISSYIDEHSDKESVWNIAGQKESDEIEVCEDKLLGDFRTYAFGSNTLQGLSIHGFESNSIIYPFENTGKVYKIDGSYVKGSCKGSSIDITKNAKSCYELKDDNKETIGIIPPVSCQYSETSAITPSSGFVEVTLQWSNITIDMDLKVNFTGEHDIKDICEPIEHFYSPSSNDGLIGEGLYPVYITYDKQYASSLTEEQKEYQDIIVTIKVPGSTEARTVNLKTIDSLSNGHIVDIKVEKKKIEVVLKDDFKRSSTVIYYRPESGYGSGITGGSGGGGSYGGRVSTGWTYTYTPPPTDYVYSIIWLIKQVLLGPLTGADISIYELKDYNLNTSKGINPVYTDKTSYGSSIYTAGIIAIPNELFESLDDDKLYIIEAKGGMDIDANDDKITDTSPTINLGTVRAVSSGNILKNTGFKLNILTEIAYQISKQYYDKDDLSKFILKSDEAIKCLLKTDINLDNVTNTVDALYFTPYGDTDKLYRNYRNEFMPIIYKIHKGEDIYDESFNLYAKPLVKPTNEGYFRISENLPKGTIIGNIETDCISESPIHSFVLTGEGSENFEVDNEGNIKVSKDSNIVYEHKRIYSLKVTGTNAYGNSPSEPIYITVTADNTPVITNSLTNYVFENMPNGSYLGTININDMGYPITDIILEGYGSEYFSINTKGEIRVSQGEKITLNDKVYKLTVTASNAFGPSAPSFVTFNIYDDIPVILNDLTITIRDNITYGTAIGKPSYYSGLSAVKEFRLTGYGSQNFNVSTDGTIRVTADINADDSPYKLYITAINEQGESEPRTVTVNVISSVTEHTITLEPLNISIYSDTPNGTKTAGVRYHYSYSPPNSFTLSGIGSERFDINSGGYITLIDNTGLSAGQIFNLEANASNEYASSTKVPVNITIIEDYLTLYNFSVSIIEGLENNTAIGKVGYSYGISPAVSFELEGSDSAYFTIDNSGTIRVASLPNYNTKQEYSFNIKATNNEGKTSSSKAYVKIIDDAPVLQDTVLSIMENSYGGEAAGYVRVGSNGKSQITSFTLSGESEYFTVDSTGLIKVATGAKIDYESNSDYNLQVIA
jgi:hypothetical protein